jgi:RES domain-containing protein
VRVYRLTRARYAAFDGRGSLFASGRWHWAGVPVIYTAESRALAALETLVHTRKDQIPTDYILLDIEVDDHQVTRVPEKELPADWRDPEPGGSRRFGDEWVRSQGSVALLVPSTVIPQEHNVLFNADHPDFHRVRVSSPQPFWWDHRLFR